MGCQSTTPLPKPFKVDELVAPIMEGLDATYAEVCGKDGSDILKNSENIKAWIEGNRQFAEAPDCEYNHPRMDKGRELKTWHDNGKGGMCQGYFLGD